MEAGSCQGPWRAVTKVDPGTGEAVANRSVGKSKPSVVSRSGVHTAAAGAGAVAATGTAVGAGPGAGRAVLVAAVLALAAVPGAAEALVTLVPAVAAAAVSSVGLQGASSCTATRGGLVQAGMDTIDVWNELFS